MRSTAASISSVLVFPFVPVIAMTGPLRVRRRARASSPNAAQRVRDLKQREPGSRRRPLRTTAPVAPATSDSLQVGQCPSNRLALQRHEQCVPGATARLSVRDARERLSVRDLPAFGSPSASRTAVSSHGGVPDDLPLTAHFLPLLTSDRFLDDLALVEIDLLGADDLVGLMTLAGQEDRVTALVPSFSAGVDGSQPIGDAAR